MTNNAEIEVLQNHFNLPSYQRRLRHLQSITVRNLVCPESQKIDLLKFQVYFTLHKDDKNNAFYTSEKITGSLNPTWQSFDLQRCDSDADLFTKFVVVRVWTGLSSKFQVRLESHVHLSGLVYFADKLQVPGLQHAPDTLLFGLYNHIFCHLDPASASPQLKQLVPDTHVPSGKLPAVIHVNQMSCRPSYSTSSLSRIHTVLRAIKQTHAAVQRIHNTIEDKLVSSSEHSKKLSRREELIIRVRQLRQELLRQTQKKQKDGDELEKYKTEIEARRERIKKSDETMKALEAKTEEERQMHIQSREMLVKENAQLLFRRKQIIREVVHYIYHIRRDEKKHFYICNVRLPNAEDYQGHDETMVSIALGLTCHLIIMVSKFLNLPLRYPMVNRGSRSVIIDHIHSKLADKEREFPLYSKGKEKFQYNYAVFLLNKNISQLRFYCGLGTHDLRETLPNLKSFLDQRLEKEYSPQKTGGTSSAASPNHSSLEGFQAGRASLAPSNSTSSFAPHLTISTEHDATDSHQLSLKQGAGPSSDTEQFDLSPLIDPSTSAERTNFKVGYMLQDAYHNLLKPNSQDGTSNNSMSHSPDRILENSSERDKGNRDLSNGSSICKQDPTEMKKGEEEEKEDLFTSTEDTFFNVNKTKSAAQILTETSLAEKSALMRDLAQLGDDDSKETIRDSALMWPTSQQQSFKLVKSSAENNGNSTSNGSTAVTSSLSSSLSPSLSPSSPMAVPSSNGRHHVLNQSSPQPCHSYQNDFASSHCSSNNSIQDFPN